MAQALNAQIPLLRGKYTVISHQDIRFNSRNGLCLMLEQMAHFNKPFIGGAYGVRHPLRNTLYTYSDPLPVDSIDECLFCLPTELYRDLMFNEELCDDWHMYAAELCIRASLKNIKCYVLNCNITHLSPGTVSKKYVDTLYRVINEYKGEIPYLWTTCAKVNLRVPYHLYIFIWLFKHNMLNTWRQIKKKKIDQEYLFF